MSKILNASPGFGVPLSEQETKDFELGIIVNSKPDHRAYRFCFDFT
jgi:hypothetical protein